MQAPPAFGEIQTCELGVVVEHLFEMRKTPRYVGEEVERSRHGEFGRGTEPTMACVERRGIQREGDVENRVSERNELNLPG